VFETIPILRGASAGGFAFVSLGRHPIAPGSTTWTRTGERDSHSFLCPISSHPAAAAVQMPFWRPKAVVVLLESRARGCSVGFQPMPAGSHAAYWDGGTCEEACKTPQDDSAPRIVSVRCGLGSRRGLVRRHAVGVAASVCAPERRGDIAKKEKGWRASKDIQKTGRRCRARKLTVVWWVRGGGGGGGFVNGPPQCATLP
jgi:hypothetical protein